MLRISVVILCFSIILCCVFALPHCEKTEIPKRLVVSNVINVIYTMESSCDFCVQQASRLPRLKRYLERKGIKTHFIIGVSHRADRLSGLVPHVQVNSRHVWRSLGELNNHFYIIDRCGRLVYEVINPWSNLNLDFVKAAVATTAHSHPCGLCPVDYTHVRKEEEMQEFPSQESYNQAFPGDISPFKMNLRLRHKHRGDPNIYNYIVKVAGLPDYHGHLPNDRGTPAHSIPTVNVATTEEPLVGESEKSSGFSSSTGRYEPSIYSGSVNRPTGSTLEYGIEHPTESSTFEYDRPTESSGVVGKGQSTEVSSISYSLSSDSANGDKDLEQPINVDLGETSHANNRIETTTQTIQNEFAENTEKTRSGDKNHSDYDDDYEKRDKELTSREEAELQTLKVHYRRILDWMDFFSDENYDN